MLYSEVNSFVDTLSDEMANELMNRHVEVQTLADLLGTDNQQSTQIPALYNQFYRTLQNPSTVSVESYKRMIDTDETLGSGVDFLVSCLVARLGAYQHDNPEVTRFVTRALDNIEGGPVDTFKEMLSASWAGFSVSEMIWANKTEGFVLEKLVTLPPSSILFSADRYGNLEDDGILQYQRNFNPLVGGGLFGPQAYSQVNGFSSSPNPLAKLGDYPFAMRLPSTFNYLSIRIPKIKCAHFAWNSQGRFGNPYGRALLRRCYNWWVLKWALVQMLGVALDRKGTPLTVVFADQNGSVIDEQAFDGAKKHVDRTKMVKAAQAAMQAFKNVHNDSVIVLPGKKGQMFDIEQLETTSNAEDFLKAIQMCNTLMLRGLLIPALVFSSGDGAGSYALGTEHAKTFDKILDGYLEGFKALLINQIVKQLICYNFDKSVFLEKGFGTFARRELTMDEREKEMNVFAAAIDKGIVDTNDLADLNKMRESIGFEPRTEPIQKPMVPGFGPNGEPLPPGANPPFGGEGEESDVEAGGKEAPFGKDDDEKSAAPPPQQPQPPAQQQPGEEDDEEAEAQADEDSVDPSLPPAHDEPDEDDPELLDQQTPTPDKATPEELQQNPAELLSDETDEGDEVDGAKQQDGSREQQDPRRRET